jgi:hypothetical protein
LIKPPHDVEDPRALKRFSFEVQRSLETRATSRPQKIATVAERRSVNSEKVKLPKRLVAETLPNNPLTAINNKSCLLDA